MSSVRKLVGQTAIYGLSSIIGRLVNWGLTPLYTARLDKNGEYGIFSDLYAFTTYFLVILTFGMETAFFRYSSDDQIKDKAYNHSFMFVLGTSSAFLLLFGFAHQGFANLLGYENRPMLVLMVIGIIFLDVLAAMPMAKLRFDERPKIFAGITLFTIGLTVLLNIFFIIGLKKTTAEYVFLANLISSAIRVILLLSISFRIPEKLIQNQHWKKRLSQIGLLPSQWKIDRELLRSMVGFGGFIMIAGLFGMINQNSDVNFITRIWGEQDYKGTVYSGSEMAGIYRAGKQLAVMILLVTQAFRYAAEPFFFRHARDSNSKVVFARVFHYFMLVALTGFLLISAFRYELVSTKILGYTLIHKDFWVGLDAVPLLLIAFVLLGAYINLSIWFKLTKQVRFGFLFSGIGVFIIVLLNLILVPQIGYMGSAIAMVCSYGAMCIFSYISGQRYYPIPYQLKRTAIYAIIFLTGYFITAAIGGNSLWSHTFWLKFLICLLCGALVIILEKWIPIRWPKN